MTALPQLTGRQVLVAEDEFLIAQDIAAEFVRLGATIVGPAKSVSSALALIGSSPQPAKSVSSALALIGSSPQLDGAVLDINLAGEMVFPVADLLAARGVPFVFTTGYDRRHIAEQYRDVPRFEKPIEPAKIVQALFCQ